MKNFGLVVCRILAFISMCFVSGTMGYSVPHAPAWQLCCLLVGCCCVGNSWGRLDNWIKGIQKNLQKKQSLNEYMKELNENWNPPKRNN